MEPLPQPEAAIADAPHGPALIPLDDEQVMRQVQERGDGRAFALLVRRWEGPIHRLCLRMTGDVHLAEDLTQEAFARVYAQRSTFRGDSRFSTFLWRIALNLCCDARRAAERRQRRMEDVGDAATDAVELALGRVSPEEAAFARERAERVRMALQELPPHYRAVVVLRHYEGLKFREIADALQIPEGTVKSRMAEALDRLAERLGPAPA